MMCHVLLSSIVGMGHHRLIMSRTERLFRLMDALRHLPPPVTAAQLGQELGVSERTLYRDIEVLRGQGAVIDGAAGYGYRLIEDSSLPPQSFAEDEIEALVLGLREVAALGDPALAKAARRAHAKLRARLPERQAHRLRHAVLTAHRFQPPLAPTVDAAALRKACWDEHTVTFAYSDKHGQDTRRDVRPLSILLMDRSHCLLAWCCLREDFRAFRLDRMTDLEVTGTSFRPCRVPLLREFQEKLRAETKLSGDAF
ncbi:putative DNA-binding transcriptional regulator YafY [Allosediminivita pacifica]|uniref:Putative DNA-binding transcriptional regulator YafY n=2 Tax=Allosediminivita pacifica TaxID=1267769 RepID=A0A2T6B5J5_9RHOB|nr:putative DNA-binding transcriptional regulator YafY [Allosediminivita pacifica]